MSRKLTFQNFHLPSAPFARHRKKKFSKVSSLQNSIYKITVELFFQNFHVTSAPFAKTQKAEILESQLATKKFI